MLWDPEKHSVIQPLTLLLTNKSELAPSCTAVYSCWCLLLCDPSECWYSASMGGLSTNLTYCNVEGGVGLNLDAILEKIKGDPCFPFKFLAGALLLM